MKSELIKDGQYYTRFDFEIFKCKDYDGYENGEIAISLLQETSWCLNNYSRFTFEEKHLETVIKLMENSVKELKQLMDKQNEYR